MRDVRNRRQWDVLSATARERETPQTPRERRRNAVGRAGTHDFWDPSHWAGPTLTQLTVDFELQGALRLQ